MQAAKDAFYVTMRDRIAQANPFRTAVVRGVERVAVLVEENELASAAVPTDAFVLRWGAAKVDGTGVLPLVRLESVIRYETAGSAGAGGMDRGRALAAMDAELTGALLEEPMSVEAMDLASAPVVDVGTRVFWGSPEFGAIETVTGRIGRSVTVAVYSYEGAGAQ